MGFLTSGIIWVITITTIHHIWLAFMYSNIDVIFIAFFLFSYFWIWFTFWLDDVN